MRPGSSARRWPYSLATPELHRHALDLTRYREPLLAILRALAAEPDPSRRAVERILKAHLKDGKGFFSADDLVSAYRTFSAEGAIAPDAALAERLRLKPVRSASGITPLTIFTKPYPCPGECIFCPNDVRMPKSYLSDEPGAQRAEANAFDPYLQAYNRLRAYHNTGHPLDKLEIIVLGGTWSFYPEGYQVWFIRRIFDALHDFGRGADRTNEVRALLEGASELLPGANTAPRVPLAGQNYNAAVTQFYQGELRRSREAAALPERTAVTEYATWDELAAAKHENERAPLRCVGLTIETRPDYATETEVIRLRRLGCTKVQIGLQSLNDHVLQINKRGHDSAAAKRAIALFRRAGFKLHLHWMPNLLGATPQSDLAEYAQLFADPAYCPDELKIYPCSLIESAELMRYYERGEWQPYSTETLTELIAECLARTPETCRLTRVIRDIPGTDIVAGNRVTNLRQVAETRLRAQGRAVRDIRAREIRDEALDLLTLDEIRYRTAAGDEMFLQWITPERKIAGFLRLFLPDAPSFIPELGHAAIIREVHVYGTQLALGTNVAGRAQHSGLGTRLVERAAALARENGYVQLAVISAVGTRAYYRARGFMDGDHYQIRDLNDVMGSQPESRQA